jgi:hypothetical protein
MSGYQQLSEHENIPFSPTVEIFVYAVMEDYCVREFMEQIWRFFLCFSDHAL